MDYIGNIRDGVTQAVGWSEFSTERLKRAGDSPVGSEQTAGQLRHEEQWDRHQKRPRGKKGWELQSRLKSWSN